MMNRGSATGRRLAALIVAAVVLMLAGPLAGTAQAQTTSSKRQATKPPVTAAKPNAQRPKKAAPATTRKRNTAAVREAPPRPSMGQVIGLHAADDPLELKSSVALVIDQDTDQVLFSKNSQAVLPIASITKLMTALVVLEAGQPLDDAVLVTEDDIDTAKGSRSRLGVGTALTRGEMLHLALMASENRAANALGRNYPGGLHSMVEAMNRKAVGLGMHDTRYVEPTGLSSRNQSSARDLALLVRAASQVPLIRSLSTSQGAEVAVGKRQLQFHNTNGLIRDPTWEIGLQKTGYIAEAGRCVVMQAQLSGRRMIMVLLDSAGRYSRIGDAERLRRWLTDHAEHAAQALPTAAMPALQLR